MSDKKDRIIKAIQSMAGKYGVYEIFADWVKMQALAYANQVQHTPKRENEYIETARRYNAEELERMCEMNAWLVEWADEQMYDMLGYIYMHLELGSKATGQFFTPYHLCRLMTKMQETTQLPALVNEPTCGAGGNIIAFAEALKDREINYQHKMLAICQDIDQRAVFMTYVQMTLYGIPAIVFQSNTLADPNGEESSTGKLYTFGYAMAPELWRLGDNFLRKRKEDIERRKGGTP